MGTTLIGGGGGGSSTVSTATTVATLVSVATMYKNATDAFNFPPRIRPPEASRKRVVVRNEGTTSVQVGYGPNAATDFGSPGTTAFNANPTIPAGSEYVDAGNTRGMWVRPVTNGDPVLVTVITELGV